MTCRILVMKIDGAAFKKGEVVSIQKEKQSFGNKIKVGNRFDILTITGVTTEDIAYLTDPLLYEYPEFNVDPVIENRRYIISIDDIVIKTLTHSQITDYITAKTQPQPKVTQDIIV